MRQINFFTTLITCKNYNKLNIIIDEEVGQKRKDKRFNGVFFIPLSDRPSIELQISKAMTQFNFSVFFLAALF